MYTQKEQHQQSFELDHHTPSHGGGGGGGMGQDLSGVEDGVPIAESNGVRGSMGSLGGPRMTPGGELMYEGNGSLSGR